jgi:hypothetical protein
MKRLFKHALLLIAISTSIIACRDSKTEADDVDDVTTAESAEVKVKNEGEKVKIKTEEKKIKIKIDDDGEVKKKVKIDD